MGALAFFGGFAAVGLGIFIVYRIVSRKLRRFSRQVFGTEKILDVLSEMETESQTTPRSLNACDQLLLPQILRDFPDFDATLASTYVREYLHREFAGKEDFTVHRTAMARYLSSSVQKTIVFQAAVSWIETGVRQQKRFDLHYTYLLGQDRESIAANCPNCGGAMGYGATLCPYCGSRVVNVLGNTWEFTELKES